MNEKEIKGIILVHETGMYFGLAFDIFVKKEYYQEFEKYKEGLYDAECNYVKKFLEKHKDYEFLGSEDLVHVADVNIAILKFIVELAKNGFEIVSVEEVIKE